MQWVQLRPIDSLDVVFTENMLLNNIFKIIIYQDILNVPSFKKLTCKLNSTIFCKHGSAEIHQDVK